MLDLAGTATLDGELRIVLIDGFVPQPGDEFVILTAGMVTGAFTSIVAEDEYCIDYEAGGVTIALAETGDFGNDCSVDLGDYAYFVDCLAGPAVPPTPTLPDVIAEDCLAAFDFDEDDDVDLADFAGFQRAFATD